MERSARLKRDDWGESSSTRLLFEHDLVGKPLQSFDHAPLMAVYPRPDVPGRDSDDHVVRFYVLQDDCPSANNCTRANLGLLADNRALGHKGTVAYLNIPRDIGSGTDRAILSDLIIVTNERAAINEHVIPEQDIRSYDHSSIYNTSRADLRTLGYIGKGMNE